MSFKIDGIQVQSFRGIRRLKLPVEGRNLIVVGENGSGKSSIVDAIEYFFTGRIQPLEGRSDVDKRQSIPNLGGGTATVELAFKGPSTVPSITMAYPKPRGSVPRALRPVFAMAASRAFVLRRHQLLNFINARPAERYEQVSQLIGLGDLDKIDDQWRRTRDGARRRTDALIADCEDETTRLSDLLDQTARTEQQLIWAVNTLLAAHNLDPIARREDLEQRAKTLRRRIRNQADLTKAEQLRVLQDSVEQMPQQVNAVLQGLEALQQEIRRFWEQSDVLEDAELERLLDDGYRILQAHAQMTTCPLCESPIRDHEALLERLRERKEKLRALTESRQQIEKQKRLLEDSLSALGSRMGSAATDMKTHGLTPDLPAIQRGLSAIRDWHTALSQPNWQVRAVESWQQHPAIEPLQQVLPKLAQGIGQQVASLLPTGAEEAVFNLLTTLTRVDERWQRLQEKSRERKKADYVSQQIALVYDEIVEARKRGLQRLRLELEADFERLYQQLHPDEGYSAITMPVQQEKRSSIALHAGFYGQDPVHPLNYYSEGHLDSLGLCIFLAFIKRFNSELKLIVLDDVLTTVDAAHRLRVARLLAREFTDYQFVITTHDQLWAKELERVIPDAKLIALKRWSLDHGADYWENILSDWDYYEEQALSGRPQDAIAGAGRNLEKFLYQMRNNLRLAIPARPDDDYTIGDLYGPFWNWVNKHPLERSDSPGFARHLQSLQKELDEVWELRNWSGAHFNAWAATVTPDEAISFVTAIKRLATSFECPVCRNLVVYNRGASVLLCPNCKPSPPPRVVWEYKLQWNRTTAQLMGARKPEVRQRVVPMVQSVCQSFLRDMRRRLGFRVVATIDDQYYLRDLYSPFFEWVMTHPVSGRSDWRDLIYQRKQALDAYWQGARWIDTTDADIEAFVDAVQQLTRLFECAECSQLLNYDHATGTYVCSDCSEQGAPPSQVSAYWFVR